MNKQEFSSQLRKALSGLPTDEIEERINFYSEMIDDSIEEGLTEQQAVEKLGRVDEIVSQIMYEVPLIKIVKEKVKPKRKLTTLEIVLLILSLPVWFPILMSIISVVISVYVSVWSVIIALFASVVAIGVSGLAGIPIGIFFVNSGNMESGLFVLGAGLICVGLAIFLYCGLVLATKGITFLTRKIFIWIKSCFVKKEALE